LVLCGAFLMVILDTTIVNVALPTIRTALHFSQSSVAWVVDAYVVAFGGLLLLAGRLGDVIGRERVFTAGITVFTAASAACGLADEAGLLVAARFVQGAGAALASAVILGMIVALFPQPAEQRRAIGVYSFVGAAGASVGQLAGGALTGALSWHWIFLVNVPLGLTVLGFARRLPVGARSATPQLSNLATAPLLVGGLMAAVFALVAAADHPLSSWRVAGAAAMSATLMAAFGIADRRARQPLVPPALFGRRVLRAANVVQLPMIAALFGMQFLVVLYLQRVLGYGPVEVGLALTPISVVIAVVSLRVVAPLMRRLGESPTLLVGLLGVAAGLLEFSHAPAGATYVADVLPGMLVLGAGAGIAMPALTAIAMADAPDGDAATASGLLNTSQQVGAALGLATLAAVAGAVSRQADDPTSVEALLSGYHAGFAIAAALAVVAALASCALLPRRGAGAA
jgi:EmrB/QacA subfamily drug resistance transporter